MVGSEVVGWSVVAVSDEGGRFLLSKGRGRKARGVIVDDGKVTDIGTPQAALSRPGWGDPTASHRRRGLQLLAKFGVPAPQLVQQ